MGERMTRSYRRAVAALEGALTFGVHPSLDGIRALAAALDRPQDAYACIQVTGTNGKSSVTRMIAALLAAHGVRVGCYTSPHLDSYTERIEIDGVPVDQRAVRGSCQRWPWTRLSRRTKPGTTSPSPSSSCSQPPRSGCFRDSEGVDFAVLEVGMGGSLGRDEVVDPAVAVITGVDIDHTAYLGDTREADRRGQGSDHSSRHAFRFWVRERLASKTPS